jgi:hypothetical protein
MPIQKFCGIIISHLGNLNGRQPEHENTLPYVRAALDRGWHICVDVLYRGGRFFLPSVQGQHVAPPAFFSQQRVWSRAMTPGTLDALCQVNAPVVPASTANFSLTSAQFLWTLPTTELTDRSIAVFPELVEDSWLANSEPAGICTNCPEKYL